MKYSQAIIVATIGSATLVSAAPTVGASQPETHHKKPAHRGSEKAHQLSHNLKQGASTALRTAGGAEGVATHLGNVVNLYRATKQFSNPEIRAVTEPATKVPAAPHHKKESSSTTSPSALKETEEQTAEAGAHHHHHKTDATHPRNKNKKIHHRIKETAGEVNPTHAKSAKAHLKTTPGETTPVSKVPTTPAAPVAVRDFLEAEDELQARLFDHFKQKYRELKAERLQKKADKAAAKAAGGEQPVYRDLLDEEEYLAARNFEDELEARGIRDAFKAAKHMIFHKHAPAVDPSQDPNMVARSFLDEDDLFERDLYDLEDLEARGIRDAFKAAKHMIFHKHAPAVDPSQDPNMVARSFLDEEDLFERGFDDFEDLEARAGGGIGKDIGRIFTKARNALKGHKTDIALTGASIGATVGSTVGVATRDLSEEEFDELIARGILGKVFSKVRNGLKGHKTDAAFTAVNVGSSMSGSSRRSFNDFEELEMRDFELNELD